MKDTIKLYYSLTKPGVLYGNALTAVAGFFLTSKGDIDWLLLIALSLGTSMVIAGACVLNNYLDQDIDKKMERTKSRALVAGKLKASHALIFSIILAFLGTLLLFIYTNLLVVIIGILGFITYVWLYGALSKRRSIHGTLVGSISGAFPILAGYCAVTGAIDLGAVIIFIIMFAWQFPEFYSISIYRFKEYKAANIPLLPIIKGIRRTKIEIFLYTLLFGLANVSLTVFGYTGYTYLLVMGTMSAYWLLLAFKGFKTTDDDAWARKMFGFSMTIILGLCVMLSVGPILP